MTKDASTVTKGINKLVAKSRGGMAGCTARLGELQAKVSAGIHPSKLLLLILTALDITDRPRITVAYVALYLVTGPPALMIESRLVGGTSPAAYSKATPTSTNQPSTRRTDGSNADGRHDEPKTKAAPR